MAKKQIDENSKEIKAALQESKAVIGTETVKKGLIAGSIKKVFLTKNCATEARSDIMHYARLGSVELVELEMTNEDLGVLCKKNFFVAVLGIGV